MTDDAPKFFVSFLLCNKEEINQCERDLNKQIFQGIRRKSSIQDTYNMQTNINSIFANLMQVSKMFVVINIDD